MADSFPEQPPNVIRLTVAIGWVCGMLTHSQGCDFQQRAKNAPPGKGAGVNINLAVQHLLNCESVGTCKGGSVDGPYQWLKAGETSRDCQGDIAPTPIWPFW